jgi:hypothetical protein
MTTGNCGSRWGWLVVVELRGVEGFLRFSKALKKAGETELRKGMHKGMRDAVNRHKPEAEQTLAGVLPSGLKDRSKVRQTVRVRTGRDPGVSVVVPYGKRPARGLSANNARMLNTRGALRRPVFPRPEQSRDDWRWTTQLVDGSTGWFDNTWQNSAPDVRRGLEREVQNVLDKIVREAR